MPADPNTIVPYVLENLGMENFLMVLLHEKELSAQSLASMTSSITLAATIATEFPGICARRNVWSNIQNLKEGVEVDASFPFKVSRTRPSTLVSPHNFPEKFRNSSSLRQGVTIFLLVTVI